MRKNWYIPPSGDHVIQSGTMIPLLDEQSFDSVAENNSGGIALAPLDKMKSNDEFDLLSNSGTAKRSGRKR